MPFTNLPPPLKDHANAQILARGLTEIEGIAPSAARESVYDLEPGTYLFACLIRETEPDGTIEDHFDLGMRLEITVE